MRATVALLALAHGALALAPPQHPFSHDAHRIPTIHESAVMARRILHLSGLGTLSTIFPASPDSLPRFSLQGYLEDVSANELEEHAIPACFARYHPDSRAWYPGNRIHTSRWVYWIGGFGNRAFIGWIPVEEWRNVTRQEVRECVLPGEEERSWWREWLGL
ncbi:hypothetical protein B0H13DRAFT_1888118 [Mycena leptocephala]|nr:hypothetical protein B0H13DRAFT_1888118 [Mycena leptocephala]